MADTIPNRYDDPYWSDLSASTETKLGLPSGLLSAIVNKGERSHNDQVSEAGAKTPYQIIPATRDAVLKKYGVDAYLSPDNAAEAAGLLLKESLSRNNGKIASAVAEYHGGTDRANWGKKTNDYVRRVLGQAPPAQPDTSGSTFSRALKNSQAAQDTGKDNIANVYKAYQDGAMTPADAQAFEKDVNDGVIMLPRGGSLNTAATPANNALPPGVIKAYQEGAMSPQDMQQFEQDVKDGLIQIPAGLQLQRTGETDANGIGGAITRGLALPAAGAALGAMAGAPFGGIGAIPGAVAGAGAATLAQMVGDPAVGAFNSVFGTHVTPPTQMIQDLLTKAGVPITDSSVERVIQAIAGGVGGGLGGVAAGRALQAAAPQTSTLMQGVGHALSAQPGAQLAAGAGAGAAQQLAAEGGAGPIGQTVAGLAGGVAAGFPGALRGSRAAAVGTPDGMQTQPMVGESAPRVQANAVAKPDILDTARAAATSMFGKGEARQALAQEMAPDPEVLASAKRLGWENYLQPDHVTTNQAARELFQAVKSVPGSKARAQEMEGLENAAKNADDIITELGGLRDLSDLDPTIKSTMQLSIEKLDKLSDDLYGDVDKIIPVGTKGNATNVLAAIKKRIDELGGPANLSTLEQMVYSKLATPAGKAQPTYKLIDDVRRDIGLATREKGPFKDSDTGLAKHLYALISDDQLTIADKFNAGSALKAAQAAVTTRKGIEDDMSTLFGKWIDGSMLGGLQTAMKALPVGNSAKLTKILTAIPQDMRPQVVASGLATAFGKNARNGQLSFNDYANWFDGLKRNQQSYNALMSNLPPGAPQRLQDLYNVSDNIRKATKQFISTGRLQVVKDRIDGADTLISRMVDVAKKTAVKLPAEVGTSMIGLPGAGTAGAIMNALQGGRTSAMKELDEVFASPQFQESVKRFAAGQDDVAAEMLSRNAKFVKFMKSTTNIIDRKQIKQWLKEQIRHSVRANAVTPEQEKQ